MGRNSRQQTPKAPAVPVGLIRTELWRFAIPILWLGMVLAISFLEAPLKFQADGITIPLGLGIGRLVFAALNTAEGILLLAYTVLAFWPAAYRAVGVRVWVWLALAAVFVFKVSVVRPPLNARTDQVIAGAAPGESPWHYIYIGADIVTVLLLLLLTALSGKALMQRVTRAA
ncbi:MULTISPECIES: hypothetical protein [unclassified Leucobacter]|uniref:hypothetical protein n=1 Tax=unclassified Leucobacter TaxID=2621730 RepID=UPI001BFE7C02|nr:MULTISPECIES: hypothetical protein [unclassified Leucobacter]